MDEFVVRGGLVYDGTGAPPAQADVWVRDGEIMAVGVDAGGSDIPAVDASGCVVTPGFVDIHRHCDAAPLRDADFGRVELAQGITCALAGNCGLAPVPLDVSRHGEFYEYIEPVVGKVPPHVCYNSYAGYVRALEQTELPLHLGFLAGIGAVRCAVKGAGTGRSPFGPGDGGRRLRRIFGYHVPPGMLHGSIGIQCAAAPGRPA